MKINKNNAKKRILFLRDEIEKHNELYYVNNKPLISDFEFDILLQELQFLESKYPEYYSENSPTLKIGSDLSSNKVKNEPKEPSRVFVQVAHKHPMLSLSNTYNKEDLYSFNERVAKITESNFSYVCELKIDGSAISLSYENNKLVRAITRGDGTEGDDVTQNVKNIEGIPHEIYNNQGPCNFEIRGEIYMPWSSFDKLNKVKKENEEALFANPRNAAAGSLKLLNAKETAKRGLRAFFYSVVSDQISFKNHMESLLWAKENGFPVPEYSKVCNNLEEVFNFIDHWDIERKNLSFPTDGIVIKLNSMELQQKVGFTSKYPRWATAYKFRAEQAVTTLISVDYQVGRTGAITPVANLYPVLLSGSSIKRASLHNQDQMDLIDVHIGDRVFIEKGGEIIPKIVGVDISKRDKNAIKPHFPEFCPDCGTKLEREVEQAKHYCPNYNGCPMQIKGRFLHFCSRKAMNILIGEATVEQMFNLGYLKHLSDIYNISREELLRMEGWKEKSADRFILSLEKSKSAPFYRVLYALGIRFVGEATAKSLANHFKSIDSIIKATKEELLEVDDIGDSVAESVLSFFSIEANITSIDELKKKGITLEAQEIENSSISASLEGKSIVVSGLFSIPRDELKKIIEQHSGKNVNSLSSKTSYLVAGQKMGPAKLDKAKQLGIKILTEGDFFKLIK
ncbi:MAG: NAD-dependent DNA ligase LigA [Bacteroidales bacterium]